MRSKTLGINVQVTPEEKEKLLKNAEYRVFRKLKQLKADCEQLETSEIAGRIDEILQELR